MNRSESKYFNTASKMNFALISLLKKKPLEYIAVSEICETAGVNRSTFYLHYETVGDLLEETARYLINDFQSYFSSDVKSISLCLADCNSDELLFICDKYLIPYLSYIRDHAEVFVTALRHVQTFQFEDVYKRMFAGIFDPILDRFHYPVESRKYAMMYYLNGINAIVMEWLKDGCDKSIEEVSNIISGCIYGVK